jgi:hypothetical protein
MRRGVGVLRFIASRSFLRKLTYNTDGQQNTATPTDRGNTHLFSLKNFGY